MPKERKRSANSITETKPIEIIVTGLEQAIDKKNFLLSSAETISVLDQDKLDSINFRIKEEALHHKPRNADELWQCVKVLFGIEIPYVSCSEENNAPFEWFYDLYFGREQYTVGLASRNSGKTFLLTILHYLLNTYNPKYQSRHAAATREQAVVASNYLRGFGLDVNLGQVFKNSPTKFVANWKNFSNFMIVTGTMEGLCLNGNASVVTDQGAIPIEDIVRQKMRVNVKSYNFETNKVEWKPVINWFDNGKEREFVRINPTYKNVTRTPAMTANHEVCLIDGRKVQAGHLKPGDKIAYCKSKDATLSEVEVKEVEHVTLGKKSKKYDITVQDNHNFFLSCGYLVSNSGQHPLAATFDEIEFWDWADIDQSWYLPQSTDEHEKIWAAISTRQRSFSCLPGYTRVLTEDGMMKISRLVNTKYSGKVYSFNHEKNSWEWNTVVNWFRNGSSKKWYKVYTSYTGLGRGCELIATGNHEVYFAPGKKKLLEDFTTEDHLCVPSWQPDELQEQILIGGMLGDSTIQKGAYRMGHSYKQKYYLDWKSSHFNKLGYNENFNVRRKFYLDSFNNCAYTHRMERDWYDESRVKHIPQEALDKLTPLGLAVWFMDDGSYDGTVGKSGKTKNRWHLYTQGFNKADRDKITAYFNKLDIQVLWYCPRPQTPDRMYAGFYGENADKITTILSPYIDVSQHLGKGLGYKKWVGKSFVPQDKIGIELVPISKIEVISSGKFAWGCYDIEVEHAHNYCNGSHVLVSNSMNRLINEAEQRGIRKYQWNVFETMKKCPSCVCIKGGKVVSNPEEHCILWEACKGKKGIKATGWVPRKDVEQLCRTLGGPDATQWKTQGLCSRPSTKGLVYHNFEHTHLYEGGNYTKWTFQPELPLYAVHDPAEGKKSVLYLVQYFEGSSYFFDELVQDECPNTSTTKVEFYKMCKEKGYPDPVMIVVDPRRTDSIADWQMGTISGTGINHSYRADFPNIEKASGGHEITNGIEEVRTAICDGWGKRRLFINPDMVPHGVIAMREYHYKVDKNNEITSETPSTDYKDEADPFRYWIRYVNTELKGGPRQIHVI